MKLIIKIHDMIIVRDKVKIILKNAICSDLRSKLYSGELDIIITIEPQIMGKYISC